MWRPGQTSERPEPERLARLFKEEIPPVEVFQVEADAVGKNKRFVKFGCNMSL